MALGASQASPHSLGRVFEQKTIWVLYCLYSSSLLDLHATRQHKIKASKNLCACENNFLGICCLEVTAIQHQFCAGQIISDTLISTISLYRHLSVLSDLRVVKLLDVRRWWREICDQLWLSKLFWGLRPSHWSYRSRWSYWNSIHTVHSEECTQSKWSDCRAYGSQTANQPKTATACQLLQWHGQTRLVSVPCAMSSH